MRQAAATLAHARVTGLMLVPPWNEDPEQTRPWFVRLREFRDRLLGDWRVRRTRCGTCRWA